MNFLLKVRLVHFVVLQIQCFVHTPRGHDWILFRANPIEEVFCQLPLHYLDNFEDLEFHVSNNEARQLYGFFWFTPITM
jgi:hypothetical protein